MQLSLFDIGNFLGFLQISFIIEILFKNINHNFRNIYDFGTKHILIIILNFRVLSNKKNKRVS